jgi:hypothetical protein
VLLNEEQCRQYDSLIRSILENPAEFTMNNSEEKDNLLAGAVSPPLTKTSEDSQSPDLLLSYNQINCLENVHRLLKSQARTGDRMSNSATATATANPTAPLTRELLTQHDRKWQGKHLRIYLNENVF